MCGRNSPSLIKGLFFCDFLGKRLYTKEFHRKMYVDCNKLVSFGFGWKMSVFNTLGKYLEGLVVHNFGIWL